MVLEPKKGLYDKFVLLLDFNSLYPSIIQEYNICFTTVSQPQDGSLPALPTTGGTPADLALLPKVIRQLVQRRRQVNHCSTQAHCLTLLLHKPHGLASGSSLAAVAVAVTFGGCSLCVKPDQIYACMLRRLA